MGGGEGEMKRKDEENHIRREERDSKWDKIENDKDKE